MKPSCFVFVLVLAACGADPVDPPGYAGLAPGQAVMVVDVQDLPPAVRQEPFVASPGTVTVNPTGTLAVTFVDSLDRTFAFELDGSITTSKVFLGTARYLDGEAQWSSQDPRPNLWNTGLTVTACDDDGFSFSMVEVMEPRSSAAPDVAVFGSHGEVAFP